MVDINSFFIGNNIFSWRIREIKPTGKAKQIYYILTIIKTEEVLKLSKFLYDNSTISMKRKREKLFNYYPIDKVGDRNLICIKCGSDRIWINGVRKNKNSTTNRYKCSSCNMGFSIKNP